MMRRALRFPTWAVAVLSGLVLTFGLVGSAGAVDSARVAAPGSAAAIGPTGSATVSGNLGTNLGAVTYYDGLVPFANLMDQAGDWIPQRVGGGWGAGDSLTLRRDGWPARLDPGQFGTAVMAEVRYPAGTYAVSWAGRGSFDINGTTFASGAGTAAPGVGGGIGRVTLDGHSLALLNLRATDPADPIRAIRVAVPGESPTAVFRAAYLRQLAPYRAVRFMDWQRTNSTFASPARTFTCDNRTLPSSYSQGTSGGVSVERMVLLANTLGVDPWFTIPHEATQAWVTCHAEVVASLLAPGLTPRYEFSNETWNPTFRAFHDLAAEGQQLGLGGGDAFLGLQLRVGQRHVAAMAAVTQGFAASGRKFLRVLAGQAANAWVLEQRLAAAGARDATDELAIAPYLGVPGANPFNPIEASEIARWSEGQLFARMSVAQSTEVDVWTAAHTALARHQGKTLVGYEGGQHLAGDPGNAGLATLFTGANRSALMGDAYRTYLRRWQAATGNALFMHFSDAGPYGRFGSWGALEYPEQGTSPKYAALVDFAAGLPGPAPTPTPSVTPTPTATPGPVRLPAAPTRLVATARDRSAVISFRAPAAAARTIKNYKYTTSVNGGRSWTNWRALSPADAASPVVVRGLLNGRRYLIKLRAVTTRGDGLPSSAVAVHLPLA